MTKKKAFTLIELLIVIAIIGILFIVLVSKVDFATDKAKATGVQTDFRSFQVAFETVAKENAGLNTFGWDTGDINGDRVRNSYDKGDVNKNGKQDEGEVFVGSKTYGETWTGVYTLVKPETDFSTVGYDKDVIFALESAINKNLDPKLHITIDAKTGKITMANHARDPWNTEYHGYYITNAEVDKKDRGAIVIYSNGANQEWGSTHEIANGVVTVNVPGNNVYGKDDYSLAVIYTYTNGYGEVKTSTSGFSNNQGGGQAGSEGVFVPGQEQPGNNIEDVITAKSELNDYTWVEIEEIANMGLTTEKLANDYNITVGSYKEVNGVKYYLVDVEDNAYNGFIFMYDTQEMGSHMPSSANSSNIQGYGNSLLANKLTEMYNTLTDVELKEVIKQVDVNYVKRYTDQTVYTTNAYLFAPSFAEIGCINDSSYEATLMSEGVKFDYFLEGMEADACERRSSFMSTSWWTRSIAPITDTSFYNVNSGGGVWSERSYYPCSIVACFVVGNFNPVI